MSMNYQQKSQWDSISWTYLPFHPFKELAISLIPLRKRIRGDKNLPPVFDFGPLGIKKRLTEHRTLLFSSIVGLYGY